MMARNFRCTTPAGRAAILALAAAATACGGPAGAEATGLVFDPNPVVASGDRNLDSSADVDPWRVTVTLTDLDGSGLLRGAWADVESPAGRAFHPLLQFHYSARDLHFEEVMAYYHITRAQLRLQALGYVGLNARPQAVTVHASGDDASWYSPSERRIYLGDGGVDDAEDADVILHEYGHALVHAAVGLSASVDAQSLSEGFADYFAASLTGDPCVGDWDGTFRPSGCLSDLTEVRHYPSDRTGDPHEDGLLWSGLLWRLREQLGADVADRLATGALYRQHPRSSFADAAGGLEAVAATLDRDQGRSDIRLAVEEVLGERGFLARRGSICLDVGSQAPGACIALGFSFLGPGAAATDRSDTLTVFPDGRCELRPLLPGTGGPGSSGPLLAPLIPECGGDAPCGLDRLRVAWRSAGGTLTAELVYLDGDRVVRRVWVTLEESGRVALEWSGEGDLVALPAVAGWFPCGLRGAARWLELPEIDTVRLEAGEGLGLAVPSERFTLAGARLTLAPAPDGSYAAHLEAAPLPAGPNLARVVTVCPSPAQAGSRAVFRLESTGAYRIELIDAAGRRVAGRHLGRLDPGLHAVALSDLVPEYSIARGTYFVRLFGGADERITKVVYLR